MMRILLGAVLVHLAVLPVTATVAPAPFPQPTGQTRILTFEDRVAAQRAIEEVYWRHRIWPEANPQPKPALDAVLPESALRAKVEDYLEKSNALEKWWQRPITGEQLQAELDRMAMQTRDPQTLRELFAALANDPLVVAETLARPLLAERLIRDWYSADSRFHGAAERKAQEEAAAIGSGAELRATSGTYLEVTWRRAADGAAESPTTGRRERVLDLASRDWEQAVDQLAKAFGVSQDVIPTNRPGRLQEDEDGFHVVAVLRSAPDSMTVATVTWPKTPFDTWWGQQKGGLEPESAAGCCGPFSLPVPQAAGCTDDTWSPTHVSQPDERFLHTAVWTGTEMIVWGGVTNAFPVNSGGRYNPATDTWVATATGAGVPQAAARYTAVWTGIEMIVWGGYEGIDEFNTGGRYNPSTDSWVATSTGANVPAGRYSHTAVWTGTEMIVWGGSYYDGASRYLSTGGRYNPSTDSWVATSTEAGVPAPRSSHLAVWTGMEMIVWGGYGESGLLNTGGRYDPATDHWVATSIGANVPHTRSFATAVWTGTEMIVWGGSYYDGASHYLGTGGRYNPATDSWVATSTGPSVPTSRDAHTAVWTGAEMVVWGGRYFDGATEHRLNTGGRYNPTADSWVATSTGPNVPTGRYAHTAVWTGAEMIVWGGLGLGGTLNTGGRFDPWTDSWVATSNVPDKRRYHTAIWTGAEMIVWGGNGYNGMPLDTGGRYDPSTDSWAPTSRGAGAPSARFASTAVWTGTEMIVWGGSGSNFSLANSGGRYDPSTDRWLATSRGANVPAARDVHTAVWTGTEMIVWGGYDQSGFVNNGGRYNPATDGWLATSTGANVPRARSVHTAVWTGTEMIVWGGRDAGYDRFNSGGRYNPSTDSWVGTSTGARLPAGRESHSAIWTGTEMIVWGGLGGGEFFSTGGRYDPATDAWVATSTGAGVPSARVAHTAIWTGKEMIVWGGNGGSLVGELDTGGRYEPATDRWVATSTGAYVPSARTYHTAVWTGSEMIVWGGSEDVTVFNSSARYCVCPSPTPLYRDVDGDGYGDPLLTVRSCDGSVPPGYVADGTDCDDADPAVHPRASETCNAEDDDCNGTVDDGGSALCDDGRPCTADACNGPAGCGHSDTSASCNDGNACTTNDTCSGGQCVGGPPPSCDDGDPCTGDACDSATGCFNPPGPDGDGDGVADGCDNCPLAANVDQSNLDGDGSGDTCDACPVDPANDSDGDGVCGNVDNCPTVSNTDQANADGDLYGDVCDPCPLDDGNDGDGDGVCGNVDNCPTDANANQADTDGDGIGDVCEHAGPADSDGDGIPDERDACDHSILDPTVIVPPIPPPPPPPGTHVNPILACDSGVPNYLLSDGCTIADKIAACDASTTNKGQFDKCVKRLLERLRRQHVITEQQRRKIDRCVKKYKKRETRRHGQHDPHGIVGGHDH